VNAIRDNQEIEQETINMMYDSLRGWTSPDNSLLGIQMAEEWLRFGGFDGGSLGVNETDIGQIERVGFQDPEKVNIEPQPDISEFKGVPEWEPLYTETASLQWDTPYINVDQDPNLDTEPQDNEEIMMNRRFAILTNYYTQAPQMNLLNPASYFASDVAEMASERIPIAMSGDRFYSFDGAWG
jgi:hypothetical protein